MTAEQISGCGGDDSTIPSQPLWWPPDKLSGRYLVPYLSRQSGENAEVVCPSKTTASRLLSIRSKGAQS